MNLRCWQEAEISKNTTRDVWDGFCSSDADSHCLPFGIFRGAVPIFFPLSIRWRRAGTWTVGMEERGCFGRASERGHSARFLQIAGYQRSLRLGFRAKRSVGGKPPCPPDQASHSLYFWWG